MEEEETEEDRWCRGVVQLGSSFTVRWLTYGGREEGVGEEGG